MPRLPTTTPCVAMEGFEAYPKVTLSDTPVDRIATFSRSSSSTTLKGAISTDAFQNALDKFKRRLSKDEQEKVTKTTYEDVILELSRIQADQEKLKSMINLARIASFLEGANEMGRVIEVFLNASQFVCFIWGPLKLLLQTASTFAESFEAFLDAYEQIGESLPSVELFSKVLQPTPFVNKALEMIFVDLLEFHKNAIRFCSGPLWRRLFRAAWKNFATQFNGIVQRLRRHRELIEGQANLMHIQQSQEHYERSDYHYRSSQGHYHKADEHFRQYEKDIIDIKSRFNSQMNEEQSKKRTAVVEWISAANIDSAHDSFYATKSRYAGTGDWILEHPVIKDWKVEDEPKTPVLWMNAIPGAGKTILASVIIEACKQVNTFSTSYYYCKDGDPERNCALGVFKGILGQMLSHCPELMPHCYEKRQSNPEAFLRSPGLAKQLIEAFCTKQPEQYIIIDGLDECEKPERREILKFFMGLVEARELEVPGKVRILFVSQQYADIQKIILESNTKPQIIALSEKDNQNDIALYCDRWVNVIHEKFELTEDQREYVRCLTISRARGMFLYAKLVLENLTALTSRFELLEAIDVSNFPEGLEEAYQRIIDRIKRNVKRTEWNIAKKLLGWMVCAKRPLSWIEIQVAISLNMESQEIEFDDRRLRIHIHDICGSLVQVLPGDRVELVHGTAKLYISRMDDIHAPTVECELAALCLQYLTFPCFDEDEKGAAKVNISKLALEGCLAFQDYAVAKWYHHVNAVVSTGREVIGLDNGHHHLDQFAAALENFLGRYEDEKWYDCIVPNSETACHSLKGEYFYDDLLAVSSHIYRHQEKGFEARNEVSIKSLSNSLKRNRKFLEQPPEDLTVSQKAQLKAFYGERRFKCRKITCLYFYEGFKDAKSRDKHVNRHDRPFHCKDPHCLYADSGFGSNKELEAHLRSYHPELSELATSFKTPTKPTTGQWMCEICFKRFTRNFHKKAHMRAHNGERPHQCPECGRAFVRLNDMKRHQKIHDRR